MPQGAWVAPVRVRAQARFCGERGRPHGRVPPMLSHMTFARNLRFSQCRTASSRPQDRLPVEVVAVPHPPLPGDATGARSVPPPREAPRRLTTDPARSSSDSATRTAICVSSVASPGSQPPSQHISPPAPEAGTARRTLPGGAKLEGGLERHPPLNRRPRRPLAESASFSQVNRAEPKAYGPVAFQLGCLRGLLPLRGNWPDPANHGSWLRQACPRRVGAAWRIGDGTPWCRPFPEAAQIRQVTHCLGSPSSLKA